ncbi:hypothetical protein NEOC65_000712 [Neochlamydia sp. AcF65]|nr:hypothetical protein [Neochlamydia sp. AcF65]MBS4170438.1 hypothetical protein [Neochlamydia sp. AcF95]
MKFYDLKIKFTYDFFSFSFLYFFLKYFSADFTLASQGEKS